MSTTYLAPLDTSNFTHHTFSWALGIRAMRCPRIASGVVVRQLGQLGIVRLTIASLLFPIFALLFSEKQGTLTRLLTRKPSCLLLLRLEPLLRVLRAPNCSRPGSVSGGIGGCSGAFGGTGRENA